MRLILEEVSPSLDVYYDDNYSPESLIQVLTDVVDEFYRQRRNKPDSHSVVMAYLRSKSKS